MRHNKFDGGINMYNKKWYRRSLTIIFSLFRIMQQINSQYNNKQLEFYQSKPVYNAICYFYDNEYFQVIESQNARLQIFDTKGDFVKGLSLPINGGIIWTGSDLEEKVYIYCVRTKCLIIIFGDEYYVIKDVSYTNNKEFIDRNHIENKNLCAMNGNLVTIKDNYGEKTVKLDVLTDIFSIDVCILIFMICIFGVFFNTGLFNKMINKSVKNVEKKVYYNKFNKKLK